MIEVEISKIIIDETKKEQVIILKAKPDSKLLPIVIGLNEAEAIRVQLSGFISSRPLTHDLIKSLIDAFGFVLQKVIVDKLVDSTFHAKLYLEDTDGAVKIIDARPSDSIALAVRTKSPIFVEEEVLERLSMGGL
ncbi:MAG: bifunctional nuclease family protein [Candidatus Omnitrophota bacterium]